MDKVPSLQVKIKEYPALINNNKYTKFHWGFTVVTYLNPFLVMWLLIFYVKIYINDIF